MHLSVYVAFPLLVRVQYPLPKPLFVFVERQVPVFRLAEYGRGAGNGAFGVNQVGCAERRAAFLALVAVGSFAAAGGACTGNVAVGKKRFRLGVIVLFGFGYRKFALVVKRSE